MIQYISRKTGKRETEKVYKGFFLRLLHPETPFFQWLSTFFLGWVVQSPLFSKWVGKWQDFSFTKRKVVPFIREYGLDPSEFSKQTFTSFNDFFTRTLKEGARPLDLDLKRVVAPADGRYQVFKQAKDFVVKGQVFDVAFLLQDEELAKAFQGGPLVLIRLCPSDYHRFHFPFDAVVDRAKEIKGSYFSVSPLATKKRLSIFWENKRMVTRLQNPLFGSSAFVEVGATCVGMIHQTYLPKQKVKKGEEKGYFSFGGSSIVLLFEKGKIELDPDLVENSAKGLETLVLMGESIGHAT